MAVAPQAIEAGFGERRLETIFRTNVQTAYMAGRYAQMMAVAEDRPIWRYVAVMDRRTRPAHRALNGIARRFDDPFWSTFYPPNGFGCRCTVQTLSTDEADNRGVEVGKGIPDQLMDTDPVTGMETPVVPMPDLGFGTNVGRDWLSGLTPSELAGFDLPPAAQALCRQGRGLFADSACRPPLASLDPRHILPVTQGDLLPDGAKESHILAFLKEFGLSGLDESTVVRLPGNFPLTVSKWLFLDKSTGEIKPTWGDKGPYMRLLARTIQDPFEAWWAPVEIGPQKRLVFALHLLRLFRMPESKEIGGYASFSLVGNQWLGATAFAPKADRSRKAIFYYLERLRGGVLIHRETLT